MKRAFISCVSIMSVGVAILTAGPALAQDAADEAVDSGDIIVTATRESTLLSKTPIALSAISGDGLRNQGITNATNLADLVPNLSIDRANGLQITIRGVTSTDGTEKGDPSAAFLLDGIYIARPQDQEVSFFDLERVEVLRGPQGTLYGRNTTAGLVNIISAKPQTDGFHASAQAQYGNFDTINVTGMINVPLSETIAIRAALNYDRRDSYINKASGSAFTLDPFKNNISGRFSALFDLSDTTSLIVRADYSKIKGTTTNSVPVTNFFSGPFVNDTSPAYVDHGSNAQRFTTNPEAVQTSRNDHTWGVNAEFNAELGPIAVTYLGSYRRSVRDEILSAISGRNPATFAGKYWQNSQELRFAFGQGNPLHGQFGAYYFKEKSGIAFFILNPQNLGFPPGVTRFGFPQDPTIAESYAGFGQLTYDLTDDLHLTGGIRYSHDLKSRVGATVFDFAAPGPRITLQVNDAKRNFSKTTWRVGLDYDAPGLGLLYATVSTGYKAGGFNDGCELGASASCALPGSALYYDPETITSYEAGFKLKLANNAFRLNGSVFHYDYSGLQLSQVSNVCGGPCQVTTNAARAKIDGIELESSIQPGPNDRVDLSVNWLHARYAQFLPIPTVSFAGLSLDRSPRYTASAGYTHTFALSNGAKIEASARTRMSSAYFMTELSTRIHFRQPGYTKSDLTLTYTAADDRWFLQGYAKNLENSITLSSAASALGGTAVFQDPRTYGVRAGFKF